MRGVIYARYSSDNQREESIEGQIRSEMSSTEKSISVSICSAIIRRMEDTYAIGDCPVTPKKRRRNVDSLKEQVAAIPISGYNLAGWKQERKRFAVNPNIFPKTMAFYWTLRNMQHTGRQKNHRIGRKK